jgi:hypothetical protein
LTLFKAKVQQLGLGLVGPLELSTGDTIGEVSYVVPEMIGVLPAVHVVPDARTNDLYRFKERQDKENKKWYLLQHYVGKELLVHFDTLVKPILEKYKSKKERVTVLMNTFPLIPDQHKIRVILEELPLEDGKDAIVQWIRNIGLEERAKLYTSTTVQDKKKEWLFSQAAVESGLPEVVLKPVSGWKPAEVFATPVYNRYVPRAPSSPHTEALPAFLDQSGKQTQTLPSKWSDSWSKCKIHVRKDYTKEVVPEIFEWLSKATNQPHFTWKGVQDIRAKLVGSMLDTHENIQGMMKDPSLLNTWCSFYKTKLNTQGTCKTPQTMSDMIMKNTLQQRVGHWKEIVGHSSISGYIWPMDLDLYTCSKLLSISILVIHNRKEFAKDEAAKTTVKRKGVEDLFITSTFFCASNDTTQYKERPCVILYREVEKDKRHVVYSPVVYGDEFVIPMLGNLPKDMLQLIETHVSRRTSP